MITKINNFSLKSFDNYTGPEDDFRAKNIIFGYNGTGKSTLIAGIQKEFLNNPTNQEQEIRVYSADYVNKKMLIDVVNRRTLKGVKAIFGELNVEIENDIKNLESSMIPQEEIVKLLSAAAKSETEISEEIDRIFNKKKGNLKIQKKPKYLTNEEVILAYKSDYEKAIKYEKIPENIEKTIGDDTIENKIASIEGLYRPIKMVFTLEDVSRLETTQNRNYEEVQIPNSIIIEWLQEGLSIHETKVSCEFCGSPIDYKKIKNKIDSYVKNEKFKAEKFYRELNEKLGSLISEVDKVEKSSSLYESLVDDIKIQMALLTKSKEKITEYFELIKKNAKNVLNLEKLNITYFSEAIKEVNKIIDAINNKISIALEKETTKLDRIGTLVKGAIYLAIQKSTLIINNLLTISQTKVKVEEANKTNKEIVEKIENLKKSKVVTVDFMDLVNEILRDLNITLELQIEGDDYIIKTTLLYRDDITIDDISEGEKNLLALIFFYFEMFEDKEQKNLKRGIKLVILDDPISSMDDSNRFYVLEIVKNIIRLPIDQVFVLTHVWDDFCQLIYGKNSFKNDSEYASYEIRKKDKSTIVKSISKGNPYKFMFKEIYELSLKTELTSNCEYFHIPNTMRKVFEEFLFFKTNGALAQNSSKSHIEDIFKITSNNDRFALGTLLTVINVLSHTNTKTNEDILASAKFLMKIIETNDPLHFHAMKQ